MRIVSFLPSATEMVYALGLEDQLVGVTHECDYPAAAKSKTVVVRSAVGMKGLSLEEIDATVSRAVKVGQSIYTVDEELVKDLAPDLILTQDLCQVCAPSGNEMGRLLKHFENPPKIVWLTPSCLSDIFENIKQIGEASGKAPVAARIILGLQERVNAVAERTRALTSRPRTFCMEWLSPPYCAGHWVGEMVALAGGEDSLARTGEDSVRIRWEEISAYAPEVLILSPCGFHLSEVLEQAHLLTGYPGWDKLPAVKNGRVYAVDADSYFARPGPRVVDGIELLAHLIHPEHFLWEGPEEAYRGLNAGALKSLSTK